MEASELDLLGHKALEYAISYADKKERLQIEKKRLEIEREDKNER